MTAILAETTRSAVESRHFRNVMGSFGTGVSILSASRDGTPFGMTVNSLTSVSLDPCLLLVCVKNGSATGAAIKAGGRFGVSILGLHQKDVCRAFAGNRPASWPSDAPTWTDETPLVTGALAGVVCDLTQTIQAGDHEIFLGQARHCASRPGAPLMFYRGVLGGFDEFALNPDVKGEMQ
jgi:3-hydroxy-9,10-secoandrosta-1,3,5(10)-triene-9,17-dione monooxygenase reductase component